MLKKVLVVLMLLLISSVSWASETTDHNSISQNSHHESEVKNKHSLGIFLGGLQTDNHTYGAYGLEYTYEFNHHWAASLVWETVDGAHDGDRIETYVASALYSPVEKVWLGVGYGKEKIHGEHDARENVYRLSAAYDFHFNHFKIAPMIAVDFVDGEQLIIVGASFGTTF